MTITMTSRARRHNARPAPVPTRIDADDIDAAFYRHGAADAALDTDDLRPAFAGASADAWSTTVPDVFDNRPHSAMAPANDPGAFLVQPASADPREPADWMRLGWSETAAQDLAAIHATLEIAEPALPPLTPHAPRLPDPVPGTAQVARHHWGRVMHPTCTIASADDVIGLRGTLAQREIERRDVQARLAASDADQAARRRDEQHAEALRRSMARVQPEQPTAPALTARIALAAMAAIGTLVAVGVFVVR
jgi:hypothetical protein